MLTIELCLLYKDRQRENAPQKGNVSPLSFYGKESDGQNLRKEALDPYHQQLVLLKL